MTGGLLVYAVFATAALIVSVAVIFKINNKLTKNKCKYDLRNIRFFLDPVGDDTYRLTFTYGELVLHQTLVSDNDIYLDPKMPFKHFVAWAEMETKDA